MRKIFTLSSVKVLSGFIAGAVLFSGTAVAYSKYTSDNTPEGGYLLCANSKTKVVTFPNKLNCPTGTVALDLGAVSDTPGPQGPDGIQGEQGPPGEKGNTLAYWTMNSALTDIVADGTINSSSTMIKKIMLTIKRGQVPDGYYKLTGFVGGLWADTAKQGSLLECYFQDEGSFLASGSREFGTASTERKSWNGVNLNILGDWVPALENTMHLVCQTSGTLKGLSVRVDAVAMTSAGKIGGN